MAAGRVVARLLEVATRPVLFKALICFSQDGVQRLSKLVAVKCLGKGARHHQLETLNRISRIRGSSNENRRRVEIFAQRNKSRLWHHAPNWETDSRQVKVTVQNLASNHLKHIKLVSKMLEIG